MLARIAAAQTTGRIDGRITDPAGAPLAGVMIIATSPKLPGEEHAATDDRGGFRLLALPPGDYHVVAQLDGFHPVERAGVRVPLGGSVVLDIGLVPAFAERITVSDRAPVIDATSPARGVEMTREVIEVLPVPRSSGVIVNPAAEGANTLGSLAPGVLPGRFGAPRVAGGGVNESRYLVDGLDTSDPVVGLGGVGVPFEFVDEVEIETGGYSAEYGGALGGIVNVLTRSGGNELRGDLLGYYRDESRQAVEFGHAEGFREYDYGVDAGGRFVRDRLWYFVAVNAQTIESEDISLQGEPLANGWDAARYGGKLTWQVSTGHRLNLSGFGRTLDQNDFWPRAVGLHGHDREQQSTAVSVAWNWDVGSSFLVEAIAGRFEIDDELHTLNDAAPAYLDLTPGFWMSQQDCGGSPPPPLGDVYFHPGCAGGDTIIDPAASTRDQLRASATWLRGRHEVKVGAAAIEQRVEENLRFPGPFDGPLIDVDGVEFDPDGVTGGTFYLDPEGYVIEELATRGSPWSDEHALFVQDRFQPTANLTLELGLRADAYRNRVRETAGAEHELEFELDDMLAPRLGVAWDFAGDGRSRLFAHIGRYFESMPLVASLLAFGPTTNVYYTFEYPADGSLPTYANLGVFLFSDYVLDEPMPVVHGTRPTHTEEASLGVEYEIRSGLALGLNLVHRELRDVIETESFDDVFVVGNPGGSHVINPATGEPLEMSAHYDEPVRRYRAIELTLRRPLRDRWQLFASYVYAESEGNYTGIGAEAHATQQFDFDRLTEGGFGPLPTDQPHQLKAYGSYTWPFDLTVGFIGQYYSGTPISKLGFWPDSIYERFVEPRGTAGRNPGVWSLSMHFAYALPLRTDAVTLDLVFDVFNVANEQERLGVDELWTFAEGEGLDPGECGGTDPTCVNEDGDPVGNPNWGQPVDFQDGRNVRFGLKLRW
jgi:outer membrane receptor protein involved in Fe transport